MASLYKQKGSEKWYIKMHRKGLPTLRIATGTADRTAATLKMEALVGDKAQGLPVNPKAHTLEFWQLAELVIADYELEEYSSIDTARRRFEMYIVPFFGPMVASCITEAEVMKYRQARQKAGAKPGTIKLELSLVRRAFTLGRRFYKIMGPTIKLKTIQNARQGFFEQADFERVLAALTNADYADVLLFAYTTGWRSGEIKDLRRRHIDFPNNCIRLDPGTTKNGDARVFPLLDCIAPMLRRRLAAPGFANDFVFTYQPATLKGQPLKARRPIGDFQKAFNTACYAAGLPCRTEPWSYTAASGKRVDGVRVLGCSRLPHDLRRTAVRNLSNMGVPREVAMQMCGHNTDEVFTRYRIVAQTDLDVAAAKMNAAFSSLQPPAPVGIAAGIDSGLQKRRAFKVK